MRYESKNTSVSRIPSKAIDRLTLRAPFDLGLFHYDEPPPSQVEDLDEDLQRSLASICASSGVRRTW